MLTQVNSVKPKFVTPPPTKPARQSFFGKLGNRVKNVRTSECFLFLYLQPHRCFKLFFRAGSWCDIAQSRSSADQDHWQSCRCKIRACPAPPTSLSIHTPLSIHTAKTTSTCMECCSLCAQLSTFSINTCFP